MYNLKRLFTPHFLLIALLIWSTTIRVWRLDYPREYVFDEVYHAFTAKMYAMDRYEAWVWWTSPPDGVAYEWTHPPLAKVIMAWGIDLFGGPGELPTKISDPEREMLMTKEEKEAQRTTTTILAHQSYSWRLFGALFGVLCTYGLYLLAGHWFQNKWIGLLAGFLFSVDLLPLVQSRTAMNDIYAVTFLVFGFYFFSKRKAGLLSSQLQLHNWLLAGIMLGCAIASKWTSLFGLGVVGIYHIITLFATWYRENKDKKTSFYIFGLVADGLKGLLFFAVIPFAIYLLSYWQLFTLPIGDYQGNDLAGDIVNSEVPDNEVWFFSPFYNINPYIADRMYIWWGLQKQMWWYHTNLDAEHGYTSKWWTWPLMVRPVWFYVNYCNTSSQDPVCLNQLHVWNQESLIGDIYTMGNPVLYWGFVPILIVFVRRYLYDYRWWFSAIVLFGLITVFRFQFGFAGFESPQSLTDQAGKIFGEVFPPVLLFSMLIVLCVSIMHTITLFAEKKWAEVKEFLPLLFALLAFSAFWLPWARSPRIMFYYHFFPPVTFMYIFMAGILYKLAQVSQEMKSYVRVYLIVIFISFVYFYPHVTAFLLPETWREQYWWFESWR